MMSTNSVEYKEYLATAMAERKIDDIKQEYKQQLQQKDKEIKKLKQKLAQK